MSSSLAIAGIIEMQRSYKTLSLPPPPPAQPEDDLIGWMGLPELAEFAPAVSDGQGGDDVLRAVAAQAAARRESGRRSLFSRLFSFRFFRR
ncbi:MAG TPA: hypothetical protein VFA54_06210 [Bryobacterales bacterium]|jgi:hypothetical protein|nr:hypothetical protein [Bryobacterales bacterium]